MPRITTRSRNSEDFPYRTYPTTVIAVRKAAAPPLDCARITAVLDMVAVRIKNSLPALPYSVPNQMRLIANTADTASYVEKKFGLKKVPLALDSP